MMKAAFFRTLLSLGPIGLMVALGSGSSALAQAPGGGSSIKDPGDITSDGTPRDVSALRPTAAPAPHGAAPSAGPARRGSMVTLVEPLWVDLTDA